MRVLSFVRAVARRLRLLRFDLLGGKRRGRVGIETGVRFDPKMDLVLEADVWLERNGLFFGNGRVRIGQSSYLGPYFSIHCASQVSIGRDCLFGDFVSVIDDDHGMDPGTLIRLQALNPRPISIGNNCWIGQGAIVLAGVTIGDGAVVAAGSVVRSNVEPNSIVAGVPARFIRFR